MNIELKAYESKINLLLLNNIVAFVLDMAEANRSQRTEVYQRCPFLYATENDFQKRYGFLYLGELLERYEERFGMSIQDLRAIALALGFTRDYIKAEMFVGPQRENFLRKVRQHTDDIYLNGALYLLGEGQSGMTERELKLTSIEFSSTEDLLFVVGLFQDHERAFLNFKPQLLRLLGPERTMPVMGNMTALNWFVTWLMPNLKAAKGRDMALFRAVCSLATAFVKPDGKPHGILLEHGYTALEIAYANMMAVLAQTAPDVLRTDSITSEKIAISLFQKALVHEEAFTPEVYEQLSQVFRMYENFKIRCGGHSRLVQTLEEGVHIQNAQTFIWFSKLTEIYHPVFQGFDIIDSKWDPLAAALEPKQYRPLFEFCLKDDLSQEEIQHRLDRYRKLTGKNYTDIYWENSYSNRFGLLVNKGILDLWDLFQNNLGKGGAVVKSAMTDNIWNYVRRISTLQAYQFFEKLFDTYGAEGLERFFGYRHHDFFDTLAKRQSYSNGPFHLELHRDFLDADSHRRLLHWLEEYVFTYKPEDYLNLITAILQDDCAAGLFPLEEQRKLFDLAVQRPDISRDTLNYLKRHYLSEAELQVDKEAQEAAYRDAERQRQAALVQSIREKYEELLDGSFASVVKYLDEYKYYRDRLPIACRTVREHLDELLEGKSYELDGQEAARFLSVCGKLIKENAMSFSEAQNYILKIKERVENDTDN